MRRTASFAAALAAVLVLTACDTPIGPSDTADEDASFFAGGELDVAAVDPGNPAGFDDFGSQIPGFGGLWFDRGCNLNVILTDAGDPEQAKKVLTPLLRRKLASSRCPDSATIVIHRGQFTYAELTRWLHEMRPVAEIRGVSGIMLNVPANRIVVGVANRTVAAEVEEALRRLGVPLDAVIFRVAKSDSGRTRGS